MPVSKAPRKPFRGNKFQLNSKEARELRAALGIILYQVQGLTVLLDKLDKRITALESPIIQIAAPGDVAKEVAASDSNN